MTQTLETIEVETGARPQAAVIWLHGLGADAHDFEPVVPELRLPASTPVRFIFPNASQRPVTINMGMRMRAWYDILQMGGGPEDEAGIRESQGLLEKLISAQQQKGIPARKIVLAGFSQGGAIALQAALRHAERLAGVMALSTYLPLQGKLQQERNPMNNDLPVLMAHQAFLRSDDPHGPRHAIARLAADARLPGGMARVPDAALRVPGEIADIQNSWSGFSDQFPPSTGQVS